MLATGCVAESPSGFAAPFSVSIDDLLEVLAEQMTDLTKIVSREQAHEAQARR